MEIFMRLSWNPLPLTFHIFHTRIKWTPKALVSIFSVQRQKLPEKKHRKQTERTSRAGQNPETQQEKDRTWRNHFG